MHNHIITAAFGGQVRLRSAHASAACRCMPLLDTLPHFHFAQVLLGHRGLVLDRASCSICLGVLTRAHWQLGNWACLASARRSADGRRPCRRDGVDETAQRALRKAMITRRSSDMLLSRSDMQLRSQ